MLLRRRKLAYKTESRRKSKLREIKAVYVYGGKIAPRVLDEYDLQDSFQKHINPGSRELPAHNGCEHDNSGVSLRNENLGALDEMETGRNIECS